MDQVRLETVQPTRDPAARLRTVPSCEGAGSRTIRAMDGSEPIPRGAESGDFDRLVARTEGLQPWRRVFHASSAVALALGPGVLGLDRIQVLVTVVALLAGALAIDLVRLRVPRLNRLFFRTLSALASPREARGPASSTWYLVGVFLTYAFFPSHAVPAILVLGLADPAASVVGRRRGRVRLGKGTVEGAAAFLTVSSIVLFATGGGVLQALVVALGVTIIELLPIPLDDNLTVPLVVAATLGLWGV
jgi:dolichol kinase